MELETVYIVCRTYGVYRETGDPYYDRYISCPYKYETEKFIITHNKYGYKAQSINFVSSGTCFRVGDFDIRNAECNGGYVTILYVIENNKIREPTDKEKEGELKCLDLKGTGKDKDIGHGQVIKELRRIINNLSSVNQEKEELQILKKDLYSDYSNEMIKEL